MTADVLKALRSLRTRAARLRSTLVTDLKAFVRADGVSFRREPGSDNKKWDASVATTCTCIMALSLPDLLGETYGDKPGAASIADDYKAAVGRVDAKKKVDKAGNSKPDEPKQSQPAGDAPKLTETKATPVGGEPVPALAAKGGVDGETKKKPPIVDIIALLMMSPWDSSELPPDNAFTRAVLLRTVGLLVEHKALPLEIIDVAKRNDSSLRERAIDRVRKLPQDPGPEADAFRKDALEAAGRLPDTVPSLTLREIASALEGGKDAKDNPITLPDTLGVLKYAPNPALGYWYIGAVHSLGVKLADSSWVAIARWARDEVSQQMALIASQYEARMDPVAMAMAACLAARLRRLALSGAPSVPRDLLFEHLPSEEELKTAVRLLFRKQGESGIWPKYFPMFHYPEAGANYCFSFEVLEAVLHEFSDSEFVQEPAILNGLEKAVAWCETNRLKYLYEADGGTYEGWNSGGVPKSLRKGIPESWATAAVHMFAYELEHVLSKAISSVVLKKYDAKPAVIDTKKWAGFLDIDVKLKDGTESSVKKLLEQEMLVPAAEADARRVFRLTSRRAALLFGPPGTSKTTMVKGLAAYLGWPFVEITPSHFLRRGLEHIPILADEIFEDLMDLSRAVVLFDEMDAMVKRRDPKKAEEQVRLDLASELLTTSMLPKLAQLHGARQVLYFFATNHRGGLDPAITRPGRFDMWLCQGPPKWQSKLEGLHVVLDDLRLPPEVINRSREVLRKFSGADVADDQVSKQLDDFTFAEVKSFLEYVCRLMGKPYAEMPEALDAMTEKRFREVAIPSWHQKSIILREDPDNSVLTEFKMDKVESCLQ